ncbi:MAG: DUF4422 domain-containing protein [Coriobacteriaceae bacterium]|nr:DUF4422 domain-containing protein [Coriobacteriaceae bacterium]
MESYVPRFTICIPSYRDLEYLPACLDSVLTQSFADVEAVVVDDGSGDGTAEFLQTRAKEDTRLRLILKTENAGLHRARIAAVEQAQGDYILFLDSDDELPAGFLKKLDEALETCPAEVLHYGIDVIGSGFSEQECSSFEGYVNRDVEWLKGHDILRAAFSPSAGFRQDWRITQRAYSRELAQRAFASMSDLRLEHAEDAYESFVLLAFATDQVTRNDLIGLKYFYGRGLNNAEILTVEDFASIVGHFWECLGEIERFVVENPQMEWTDTLAGARMKLRELLFNEWHVRIPNDKKIEAAQQVSKIMGGLDVGIELMRLTRDAAYAIWDAGEVMGEGEPFHAWFEAAKELAGNESAISPEFQKVYEAAKLHISELRERALVRDYEKQDIRIFVSTHKRVDLFDSKVLQPVQVGAAMRDNRFSWTLHDDEGENISTLNPMYCELTTQYWAWKNVDAPYIGFCHYRRYFDFSDDHHKENLYGEVMDDRINAITQSRYQLDDASIARTLEGVDVVTTTVNDVRPFAGQSVTMRSQYDLADQLYVEDLDRVMDILVARHPEYREDVQTFLSGHTSCFCNMFIMRRDIFRAYCEWLFPLLEEFVEKTDMSCYSREGVRTPGHLSERLLNVYLLHHERIGSGWVRKQLQCVHFERPDYHPEPKMLGIDSEHRPVIPVVLASDNAYVPMLTTTIFSALANASTAYRYDVVVLHRGISGENQHQMRMFLSQFDNANLRFCDVTEVIADYHLTTNNPHISVETYYRFLIQKLLPFYDKVLYLDSDLIVKGDISELFVTDLGDNLLGAVRDIDFAGNVNMKRGDRRAYAESVLGMKEPFDYFQAGVLLLNTRAMRALHPIEEWLELAADERYIYNDQDVLNACCEGRVTFLPWDWNVMIDCAGRIGSVFSFAPASFYDAFLDSRGHEKIVHYAGFEKPWKMADCDRSELYWNYARETPFYERLLSKLVGAEGSSIEKAAPWLLHDPSISPDNKLIRGIFDPLLPMGSARREFVKSVARRLRGIR